MDAAVTILADGFSFLESPRWHDGALYLSDFYTHRVLRMGVGGEFRTLCEVRGQPSGLGFDPQDRLLVVSMTDRRLLRLDAPGRLTEIADLSALAPYHCNDMIVDRHGRAYVGNFGSNVDVVGFTPTCLIMVEPGGGPRSVATDLIFPNGMAIAADGTVMLVAESFAHRISAFAIARDGTLHSRQTWATFGSADAPLPATITEARQSGRTIPDGICLDADGALWVADATGTGALRLGPDGAAAGFVDTSPYAVYAATLGGADGSTLFMCAAPPLGSSDPTAELRSALLCCQVDVPAPR
jgi:sugar lactone lactonase YvrE